MSYKIKLQLLIIPLIIIPVSIVAFIFISNTWASIKELQFKLMDVNLRGLILRCEEEQKLLEKTGLDKLSFYKKRVRSNNIELSKKIDIPGGYIFIVTSKGKMIYHPNLNRKLEEKSFLNVDFIQKICQLKNGEILYDRTIENKKSKQYIARFSYFPKWNWIFVATAEENIVFDAVYFSRNLSFYLTMILIFLAVGILFFIARSISRPIELLKESSIKMSKGDLAINIDIKAKDELGFLAQSFNQMAYDLKSSFEKIQTQHSEIQEYSESLEKKVQERTKELSTTLENLKKAQNQLLESEKMAALGQVMAGVAHEINTPLGAIRSSVENIASNLTLVLRQSFDFFKVIPKDLHTIFLAMLERVFQKREASSAREERKYKKELIKLLEHNHKQNAMIIADNLVDMGIYDNIDAYLPLFQHSQGIYFLEMAYKFSGLQTSTNTIITAIERASKVVIALKSYARYEQSGEMIESDITEDIETVLTLYHNHLKHGVEVIRYFEDLPPVICYPDELYQVWINIIDNALHAMAQKGTLEIHIAKKQHHVMVTIVDSGKGIPEEYQQKIFDPFFTTKNRGEGSGLGLDIVKKIVYNHQGKIKLESRPGKTAVSIILPINNKNSGTK